MIDTTRPAVRTATAAPIGAARLIGAGTGPDLQSHLARLGPLPTGPLRAAALITMTEAVGLAGRGGGGFPTSRKIAGIAASRRSSVLVINACEGDPTAMKDAMVIGRSPHLVLDGAITVAQAIGAGRVVLASHRGSDSARFLADALLERGSAAKRMKVVTVPARFVASEASSLVNYLNNGDARPSGRLAPIWESGVDARPTMVLNAETVSHIGLLARFGADWFRSVGSIDEPGTALVTVNGAVRRPGVVEVANGTSIGDILRLAGSAPAGWALIGGLAGRWADLATIADVPFTTAALRSNGLTKGVASISVIGEGGCVLNQAARVLDYLAAASAGQCGPCMFGLPAIAADMRALMKGDSAALDRLRRRLPVVKGRGGCAHPDGAVAFAASTLGVLTGPESGHLRRHLAAGPCPERGSDIPLVKVGH